MIPENHGCSEIPTKYDVGSYSFGKLVVTRSEAEAACSAHNYLKTPPPYSRCYTYKNKDRYVSLEYERLSCHFYVKESPIDFFYCPGRNGSLHYLLGECVCEFHKGKPDCDADDPYTGSVVDRPCIELKQELKS